MENKKFKISVTFDNVEEFTGSISDARRRACQLAIDNHHDTTMQAYDDVAGEWEDYGLYREDGTYWDEYGLFCRLPETAKQICNNCVYNRGVYKQGSMGETTLWCHIHETYVTAYDEKPSWCGQYKLKHFFTQIKK